ncbi:MAG: glycosyltransferase family 4 protein [Muribaculaceae bacterium]|nr:glycosyltransferase family 4 protein [Muribaculaceae bacterium]
MKIAFLSEYSPLDRKASSGTNFKMAEQLSLLGELKWVPIKRKEIGHKLSHLLTRIAKKFGGNLVLSHTLIGRRIMYEIPPEQAFEDCDIIAAFFCSPILGKLKSDRHIVYFTDATFPVMVDYYWHNLPKFNIRQGTCIEKSAMDNSAEIVVSSRWAAQSAVHDINQSPSKVNIIEFGANVDDKDILFNEKKAQGSDTLNLLFLGVDWKRKGGEIAVSAARWLNENGIPTTLHIVGIKDLSTKYTDLPFVSNHGFLNKNNKDDFKLLHSIFSICDAEILPTLAECAGIAFAEAAAYGLPVFTHDTGGTGNYVINEVNGYRLPLGSTGEDFGERIKDSYLSGELARMSSESRELYRSRLNWNVWREKVGDIFKRLENR